MQEREICALKTLAEAEALAEKKLKIFSRILMDINLTKELDTLSKRHGNRRDALMHLMGEEPKNKGGMYEMNAKENAQ